jgi:hypothetical protein
MPQRYKVRLGDGTVLSVDSNGLRTWAGDGRATVQAVGSWRWQPLQEFLAEEEAAARLARALVPPQPREEVKPPEFDLGAPPPAAPTSRPSVQALADDPMSIHEPAPAAMAGRDDLPVIPMKPLDDEPALQSAWSGSQELEEDESLEDEPRHDRLEGPLLTVLETVGGFLGRVLDHLTPLATRLSARMHPGPRDVSEAVDLPRGRATTPAAVRAPPAPVARPAVAAPTPVTELPVLRFVESRETREREDVYEDDAPSLRSRLHAAWLWTKRIVTTGVLVAALAYAVLERDVWFPKTAELGQTVFTQIHRQVLSGERQEQKQRALADAALRLPELASETIELIFSRSPTGIAEAGEVFQLAREAADRGRATLAPSEQEELRALALEVLGALSRTEAERVREYDRTRARRPIFPFENPHVMEFVARGARALPTERLERLQTLSHRAVAAGLDMPERTSGPSPRPGEEPSRPRPSSE